MTKEVIVTICGLQSGPDTDGEPIEMITTGEYFYKNNKHYILYEEVMEGETAPTKNRIKIAPGYMELTKRGLVSVDMLFEENKKNITHYNTPYGSLLMGIEAKKVEIAEAEDEIKVSVDYALELNEEHAADCDIKIAVRSKSAGGVKLT
jgi:uncharacterized beta-barrel protein YwiB (DUF1934 family)